MDIKMDTYHSQYIEAAARDDLNRKIVFIGGLRHTFFSRTSYELEG
jgi:hypothetical protein